MATTGWFLADLHRGPEFDGVTVLVKDANCLGGVRHADGYDFDGMRHGARNSTERVFREV